MTPFDFHVRTRFVFGPDRIDQLGSLAAELDARRALVVSDPGIVAAGHAERGLTALRDANLETCLFDGAAENPTTEHVEAGVAVARRFEPDLIVGLGGGSSMDCAKGVNFLLSGGGRMQDYWGVGKARGPMLPMIAVPTTGGTGSEAQSFALVSDAETHVKMACGDRRAACRVAILDPCLTVTQPREVTALTGIDAIAHAVETFVTTRRSAMSQLYSHYAWRLLSEHFNRVLDDPHDLPARAAMQCGACMAGLAIENSMLGAAHALANPLTARFNLVHGQAVGMMLPHVVRFNGQAHAELYDPLVGNLSDGRLHEITGVGPGAVAGVIEQFLHHANLPNRLAACGVDAVALPTLAAEAATQWTAQFNPRPVDESALLELYRTAL